MLRKFLFVGLVLAGNLSVVAAQEERPVSLTELRSLAEELSNKGRWGAGDRLGTLNLITPAIRQSAAALVRAGIVVSLAHDLVPGENQNALRTRMTHDHFIDVYGPVTWGQDTVSIFPHGYAYSHLDALSHAAFDEAFYNGYGIETLTESGSVVLGVDVMRDGIASRGVLIDLPRHEEVEYLEPRTLVTVADLEAWERSTGERVGEGDVLLVRTGRWAREAAQGRWTLYCPGATLGSDTPIEEVLQQCREADEGSAGLHPSVARWLRQRGVAAVGGDGANERYPTLVAGISDPFHMLTIAAMGMPLFDNLDFEALAHTAVEMNRQTFFFVAAPLRIRGGSGSPVNPVAIF